MKSVNIHEAKTHFSRLVGEAAQGEQIIIAKAGRPVAKLSAIDSPTSPSRVGFLAGQISFPDDFDTMGSDEIATMFDGVE